MARDIIIIKTEKAQDGTITFTTALWLTTPTVLVKVDQSRTSLASVIATNPTTAAELQAIRDGTITEQSYTVTAPAGTTNAQVGSILVNGLNAAQAALNGRAPAKDYTGTFHDSVAGWTVV